MSECIDCSTAARELWHGFRSDCRQCTARAVSRGPDFFRVRNEGRLDKAYLEKLQALGVTHLEVKQAGAVDAAQKGVTC